MSQLKAGGTLATIKSRMYASALDLLMA